SSSGSSTPAPTAGGKRRPPAPRPSSGRDQGRGFDPAPPLFDRAKDALLIHLDERLLALGLWLPTAQPAGGTDESAEQRSADLPVKLRQVEVDSAKAHLLDIARKRRLPPWRHREEQLDQIDRGRATGRAGRIDEDRMLWAAVEQHVVQMKVGVQQRVRGVGQELEGTFVDGLHTVEHLAHPLW